jgi:TusA-related sulfurtransferase
MHTVNCVGLKCPLPILHSRLKINSLRKGDQLEILADDAGFIKDFKTFCFQADLKLLEFHQENNSARFIVEILR